MFELDERNKECPIPVIDTKHKLKELKEGDELTVKVSKAVQVDNVSNVAKDLGLEYSSKKISDTEYEVYIKVTKEIKNMDSVNENCTCGPIEKNIVVVVASDVMGYGDDKLGHNLLKAFIFALTQTAELPNTILFYNGGAKITCEGSESIDDLKKLEGAGVKIKTCGTCLDFYGIKEKLKVGVVTNMYDIVETEENASVVLKP